jgi:hypothetical protein
MNAKAQRILGGLLILLVVITCLSMPLLGVSLITMHEVHFVETGVTSTRMEFHWLLKILAGVLIFGLALLVIPALRRPKPVR